MPNKYLLIILAGLILTPPYEISGSILANVILRAVLVLCVCAMFSLDNTPQAPKSTTVPTPVKPQRPVKEQRYDRFVVAVHDIFKKYQQQRDGERKVAKWAKAIVDLYEGFNISLSIQKVERLPSYNTVQLSINSEVKISSGKERKVTPQLAKISKQLPDVERVLEGKENVTFLPKIAGKPWIGFVIPSDVENKTGLGNAFSERSFVSLLENRNRHQQLLSVPLPLGFSSFGHLITIDLADARTPHILVGGTTGSGKSTALNLFICALSSVHTPDTLKIDLIDVKRTEFSAYSKLPHLSRTGIAMEPKAINDMLDSYIAEMEDRYVRIHKQNNVKNLADYNRLCKRPSDFIPYRVLVVDELAEVLLSSDNRSEIEKKLIRFAQMGRAAGMSLIISTQRPDSKILPPLLTSNVPARVAFKVVKGVDSKIILGDSTEAANLKGNGDGIVKVADGDNVRFQGIMVSNGEVKCLVKELQDV